MDDHGQPLFRERIAGCSPLFIAAVVDHQHGGDVATRLLDHRANGARVVEGGNQGSNLERGLTDLCKRGLTTKVKDTRACRLRAERIAKLDLQRALRSMVSVSASPGSTMR